MDLLLLSSFAIFYPLELMRLVVRRRQRDTWNPHASSKALSTADWRFGSGQQ
jgi:hypothetical protein